jgi:flavodoxin
VSNATIESKTTYLFLGSGCYGGKPSPVMMKFIESNDFSNKKIGLFGTSGSGKGTELEDMKMVLDDKGAKILGSFSCTGKTFFLINRKHPSTDEISQAKDFARNLVTK